MTFLDKASKPFFVLAPMDDVTDTVFRQVIADTAPPDLFFTEFVNVDALQSKGRVATLPRLQFTKKEKPIIAQLWGLNPENFYKSAKEIATMGYDGIDLNFGCPDRNVVRNGACSAFILPENRSRAIEIIKATQEGARAMQLDVTQGAGEDRKEVIHDSTMTADRSLQRSEIPASPSGLAGLASKQGRVVRGSGSLPVSAKTRTGFAQVDLSWHELLLKQTLNMLTIHGRTKSQLSKVPADWQTIGRIRELRDSLSPDTLIVGNGDVMTRAQGEKLAKKYGLDGIMIGRGVFHDPYVFAKQSQWPSYSKQQKLALYKKHVGLFAKTWDKSERKIHTLNKFCKIYIQGFDGAKELRESLMQTKTSEELLQKLMLNKV